MVGFLDKNNILYHVDNGDIDGYNRIVETVLDIIKNEII